MFFSRIDKQLERIKDSLLATRNFDDASLRMRIQTYLDDATPQQQVCMIATETGQCENFRKKLGDDFYFALSGFLIAHSGSHTRLCDVIYPLHSDFWDKCIDACSQFGFVEYEVFLPFHAGKMPKETKYVELLEQILIRNHEMEISSPTFSLISKDRVSKQHELDLWSLQQSYGSVDPYEHDLRKSQILRKYSLIESPDYVEEINIRFDLNDLAIKKQYNRISDIDFERAIADAQDAPWYRFSIIVDYDKERIADDWYFDIDYNHLFVELLVASGYDLSDAEKESLKEEFDAGASTVSAFETLELLYENHIIEGWVKENMVKIVAGMLKSENGNTFTSVGADDPAAEFIRKFEIDNGEVASADDTLLYPQPTNEKFDELVKELKKRKLHKG